MAKGTIALGQFRGKCGGQVFRVVDGAQVIQNYNPEPKKSSTIPQVAQRNGMSVMSRIGSAMLPDIKMGFGTMSYPFSRFIKRNLRYPVVTGDSGGSVEVNYGQIVIAEDTLHQNTRLSNVQMDWGESVHLQVKAQFDLSSDVALADLKVHLVIYNPDLEVAVAATPVAGSADSITVTVPFLLDGQSCHAYMYVSSQVGRTDEEAVDQTHSRLPYLTSASAYAGAGEIN